jgi:hypothetical protein
MIDRHQFAALVLASQLGVVSKQEVVAKADQCIMEVDQPDYWLIELSSDGYSSELGPLIDGADDTVYGEVLRMVFEAWIDGSISDERFVASCSTLWKKAGYQSRWYTDLCWIVDEFDLVADGVFRREDSVKKVRASVEKLLER